MADKIVKKIRRSFKYRIYPTKSQARDLAIMLETHRRLHNNALEHRKAVWSSHRIGINSYNQSNELKEIREDDRYLSKTNFSSCQATLRRLDKTFNAFFQRIKRRQKAGYPRFKSRDRFNSILFPSYRDGIRLIGNRLRVQHIGRIKVRLHRLIEGKIKTVSLKREGDKWFAVFSCDLGNVEIPQKVGSEVGIDVGIENFYTDNHGLSVENPRFLKTALPELRRAGRSVSRKKKEGKNRRKAVKRLQKVHARVRNCRHDHRHKESLKLIRRCSLIAVEKLSIKNMMRNHRLARSISDVGWRSFIEAIRYKAEKAGIRFVEVDPRGTSQQCSGCGKQTKKSLSVRQHRCPYCSLSLHRDHNAALNILARARLARTGPAGLKPTG